MEANMGGTYIDDPLEELFEKYPVKDGISRSIFLISDGGIADPDSVVNLVYKNCQKYNQRVYALGIGEEADISLIMRASQAGNGKYEYAVNSQKIEEKLQYLIEDSISEFLDNFQVKFSDNSKIGAVVPRVDTIQSVRMNEAFTMFVFLKDLDS